MNNQIIAYKPPGLTPLELIESIKRQHGKYKDAKITYAGRLDPLAEGLMILLVNDAIKHKETILRYDKTYEVQVLVGVTTDTLDCLGIVHDLSSNPIRPIHADEIEVRLQNWIGSYDQPYPSYSSKTISGKPLWLHAREGKIGTLTMPTKLVSIYQADFIDVSTITSTMLIKNAVEKIKSVNGDFRQLDCVDSWQSIPGNQQYPIYTLRITASSGTYMRQLAKKLGDELRQPSLAFHIKRTAIGPFELANFEAPYEPILLTHNVAK